MELKDKARLSYKKKSLQLEGQSIAQFVKKYGTPFYIYSNAILMENYLEYEHEANANGLDAMICFALKANANPHVLKCLAKLGAGADIVSGGELKLALKAGIKPNKIVFSGVGKTESEIQLALKHNIYSFNVESIEELELINNLAKKMKKRANIAFRLNPKVVAKTHKHISTGFKTHKFGIIAEDIIRASKNKKLWTHCDLKGLSIHIGSQLTSLEATIEALEVAFKCAKNLPPLEFIDVGGGLGVSYNLKEAPAPTVSQYMQKIAAVVKSHAGDIKVVFEPGRRIVASAGFFVTSVLRNKISEDCRFLIVDGGMNDFVRPSLYDAYHEIIPGRIGTEIIETDVVGPICETADCFGQSRPLPVLKQGDFILIADTGAYGQTMSSTYNQRKPVKEYFLKTDGKVIK